MIWNKCCNFENMKLKIFLFSFLGMVQMTLTAQFYTNDSIVSMFRDSLNNYRKSLSLNKVSLEPKYKNFVDRHSSYQAKINYVTHGEESFSFENRANSEPSLRNLECQENCTVVLIDLSNTSEFISSQIFRHFKNSKPHNAGLINPNFNKMYLSCYKKGEYVFVTLLLSE